MSRQGSEIWLVLHVVYSSLPARNRLIVESCSRIAGDSTGRRWYFADVPLDTPHGDRPGLELSVRARAGDNTLEQDLLRWLEVTQSEGLIDAAVRVERSKLVRPDFFPGGVVPAFYRGALAAGTARASSLLGALPRTEEPAISDALVRAELVRIHMALVPRDAQSVTLAWHAAWLKHLADSDEELEAGTRPRGDRCFVHWQSRADLEAYRRMRPRIMRYARRVAAQLHRSEHKMAWRAQNIRAAVVARLAHTQAVRLWGPSTSNLLLREAALVRSLG